MRLAILGSRGFPSTYGGYETLVRYIARYWADQGHDVTVYCRERPDGRRASRVEQVKCVWTPGRDTKSASTLSFGLTSHLHAALYDYDAALIVNIANGYFLPLLRARGIPSVVNTDGLEWERGKWNSTARRVFYQGAKLTARYADVLVSDSEAIAAFWEQHFGVSRPTFIPYGGDVLLDVPKDRVKAIGLEPGSYVLSVARLIPENNVELTLDALDCLKARPPVVVVGSANYESALETRLHDLDHRGRVRWLGHVSDQELLTQLWAHAGVYVHGHSVGGTNPALLQALGSGAPTLALDTPYNYEVLRRPDQLYQPNSAALAARIRRVLDNEVEARDLAATGRAIVAERYQWSDVCAAYDAAIAMAIDSHGQTRS